MWIDLLIIVYVCMSFFSFSIVESPFHRLIFEDLRGGSILKRVQVVYVEDLGLICTEK